MGQHGYLLREGQHARAQTGALVSSFCPFLLPGGPEVTQPLAKLNWYLNAEHIEIWPKERL